jgi:hypothetical protein
MTNWKELEEFVKKILPFDHPIRTPGSGSSKGEEDVIGRSTISQCKFTSDKNTSILHKDVIRLRTAANILDKFPLFFTKSSTITLMSIPLLIETTPIADLITKIIVVWHGLTSLLPKVGLIKDIKGLNTLYAERDRLVKINQDLKRQVDIQIKRLDNAIDTKKNDILTYNLFEQENTNATEC